jgi:hypothetical protein
VIFRERIQHERLEDMGQPPEGEMPRHLVKLTGVETQVEAEVIISMLSAYGIYAMLAWTGRGEPLTINVVDADLEDARTLLSAADEQN